MNESQFTVSFAALAMFVTSCSSPVVARAAATPRCLPAVLAQPQDAGVAVVRPSDPEPRVCPAAVTLAAPRPAPPLREVDDPRTTSAHVGYCPPQSADAREAMQLYEQLDAEIEALAPAASLDSVRAKLAVLLGHRCATLHSLFSEQPVAASVASLRDWWDIGGASWLKAVIAPESDPPDNGRPGARRMWFAPTERWSLSLETHADSPLASVLCEARDEACGAESRVWRTRVEQLIEGHVAIERLRRLDHTPVDRSLVGSAPSWPEECERRARAARAPNRFGVWVDCIEPREFVPRAALPLGHFRLPTGWLLIQGRRGHYSYCDEIRAYHLESGSAYVARRCSRLFMLSSGADSGAPEDTMTVEQGSVDVAPLREAALSMLLATQIQGDVRSSAGLAIPDNIDVRVPTRFMQRGLGFSVWFSSAQTLLSWSWFDRGCERARGTLVWPSSGDAGDNIAAHMLQVAEATETSAPPTMRIADYVLRGESPEGGVSPLDADPNSLANVRAQLLRALRAASAPR